MTLSRPLSLHDETNLRDLSQRVGGLTATQSKVMAKQLIKDLYVEVEAQIN